MTAEVQPVYVCDEAEARELTDAIKGRAGQTWALIVQAYQHRAWAAMGYETWDAYCSAEFGTTRLRIPRDARQEIVSSYRDAGLSVRAISSATGESVGSVHRALAGVPNGTPDLTDSTVPGGTVPLEPESAPSPADLAQQAADGFAANDSTYAGQAAGSIPDADDDIADAEIIDDPEPATVTGLDGKTYQPTGRKPPRKALVEVAKTRGFALRSATDSLLNVFKDDRLAANEKQVADALRGHLLYVAETVTAVIDQLP